MTSKTDSMENNRLIVDLDGTLTIKSNRDYADKEANKAVIEKLREYAESGFLITIFTSRNMRSFGGDLDEIKKYTLPIIESWLDMNNVPYDEILIGKPWPGENGFYIDDRAVRPDEFCSLGVDELRKLTGLDQA